jgi:glycerophosphoryl diester phosphodiesterase
VTTARPIRIAHAYGNRRDRLALAIAADVDMIEADVWFHGGEVHVRHEHRLGRLPLLVDRRSRSMPVIGPWAMPLPRRYFIRPDWRPFPLGEVLAKVAGDKRLLIDVKGAPRSAAEPFARAIGDLIKRESAPGWTTVCGYWPVLDAIRATGPDLDVRYTVDTPKRLAAYLERHSAGRATPGICAYHGLLNAETMQQLTAQDIDVYAWTVDDPGRAAELLALGVSGITSNDLSVLAALPAEPQVRSDLNTDL